jgi:hypothetical protein
MLNRSPLYVHFIVSADPCRFLTVKTYKYTKNCCTTEGGMCHCLQAETVFSMPLAYVMLLYSIRVR